jgi:hypothetical protein
VRKTIVGFILLLACTPLTLHASDEEQANPCNDCHEVDLAQFEATVHGTTESIRWTVEYVMATWSPNKP